MANGEGREPPAFQIFAASRLAARPFRLMNARDRGVEHSMELECWVNKTLPSEPNALALILGLDRDDVTAALPTVMAFFTVENGEIRCPELDAYRAHLEVRRLRLSEGGKAGAAITNADRKKPHRRKIGAAKGIQEDAPTPSASPPPTPSASGRPLSPVQSSTAKSNTPLEKCLAATDPFITEYDAAQSVETRADAYRRASRGE